MIKPDRSWATNPGNPANGQIVDDDVNKTSKKTYKNISSKKQKDGTTLCPFLCPHCNTLGPEYLRTRYEPICILSDSGDSIFSPMDEKYHDEDKTSVRNGKVFLSADLVDDFLKKFKK